MKVRSPEAAASFNLAVSLACLGFLALAAYYVSAEQRKTDRLVRHTQTVVSHVTELQQLALDAESTGRAFLLVGDPGLLKRYEQLLPQVQREVATVIDLLAADADSYPELANVRQRLETRFSFLTQLAQLRAQQGREAALAAANKGLMRAEMAYVGAVLSELKNEQNARLRQHLAQRERVMLDVWVVTVACVIVGFTLVLWMYHQTRRANATRRADELQKEYMARHDPLTGLANRRRLQERLEAQIADARRTGSVVVVMYLDLDGFKQVNDTFGHDSGDELLVDVARRLRNALRETDIVARLGGDEFVLSLPHLHSVGDTEFVAAKVKDALAAPYELAAGVGHVTASIGVAMFPRDGETPRDLLVAADRALYAAKSAGKNCYQWARAAAV